MSSDKNFLERWSRRKQEARQETNEDANAEPPPNTDGEGEAHSSGKEGAKPPGGADRSAKAPAQEFDIASLPSIESITAGTDVRAFLAPGVPQHLTRAALRRAWSADPAIREYIGLSEYSWDFNAPDSMLGFEPLRASDDIKKLLAEVFGDSEKPVEQRTAARQAEPESVTTEHTGDEPTALPGSNPEAATETPTATSQEHAVAAGLPVNETTIVQRNENTAAQHDIGRDDSDRARSRPRHGGALPKV